MRQYIGGRSMQLNSDLTMFHPLWERADNELCSSKSLGIFGRLVDVYVLEKKRRYHIDDLYEFEEKLYDEC